MNYRNKKLVDSARDVDCVSCQNPEACWCHSNSYEHGKGRGIKAHDIFGFYGCMRCHDWYDGRRNTIPPSVYREDTKQSWFMRMNELSLRIAAERGYL